MTTLGLHKSRLFSCTTTDATTFLKCLANKIFPETLSRTRVSLRFHYAYICFDDESVALVVCVICERRPLSVDLKCKTYLTSGHHHDGATKPLGLSYESSTPLRATSCMNNSTCYSNSHLAYVDFSYTIFLVRPFVSYKILQSDHPRVRLQLYFTSPASAITAQTESATPPAT